MGKLHGFHTVSSEDHTECYLAGFERQMYISKKISGTDLSVVVDLESYLMGKAQKAAHFTSSQRHDSPVMRQAILNAYKLTPDSHREKF